MGSTVVLQVFVLTVLITLNTSGLLIARHALSLSSNKLNIKHVILVSEIGKVLFSCVCEFIATRGNLSESLRASAIAGPREALKPAVPAVLYLIQNILTYYAIPRVSPPVLQVTLQGKLIVTAIISYFLLDRRYTRQQYVCLIGITVGVAIVVAGQQSVDKNKTASVTDVSFLGLLAVGISCVLNAVAGVVFEIVLKKPSTLPRDINQNEATKPISMWIRNMQLAGFTIVALLAEIFWSGTFSRQEDGPIPYFSGFTSWIWLMVAMRVAQSIVITAVLKYTDTVRKGIATCVSLCLCTALSSYFFGTSIGAQFVFGASLVLLSTYVFSNPIDSFAIRFSGKQKLLFLFFYVLISAPFTAKLVFLPEPFDCNVQCDDPLQQLQCRDGELEYLTSYPDLADAGIQGGFNSSFHHFNKPGAKDGHHYFCDATFTAQQHCLSSCFLNEQTQQSSLESTSMFGLPPRSFNDTYFYKLPRFYGVSTGAKSCTASYGRSSEKISQRSQQGNCAAMLDVLQWLSGVMEKHGETIMLTGGGLIKVLRDKTFFWKNGTPIDDDMDFLASFAAFDFVSRLEPLFWQRFGWTTRTFYNCDGYRMFMQLVPACGHKFFNECSKASQTEPTIEFYAMYEFRTTATIAMLWEQEFFPAQLMFPPRPHMFNLPGSNRTIDFYIPRKAEDFLTCLYGNWSAYAPASTYSTFRVRNTCFLEVARQMGIHDQTADVINRYSRFYIPREWDEKHEDQENEEVDKRNLATGCERADVMHAKEAEAERKV